jgi:phage tail tape-measure protein
MPKRLFALIISLPLILAGCATAEKSTLLGAAIGSTAGLGLGALASQHERPAEKTQGALIGLGLGGLIGALIGYEVHKDQSKKDQEKSFNVDSARLEMFGSAADKDTGSIRRSRVEEGSMN